MDRSSLHALHTPNFLPCSLVCVCVLFFVDTRIHDTVNLSHTMCSLKQSHLYHQTEVAPRQDPVPFPFRCSVMNHPAPASATSSGVGLYAQGPVLIRGWHVYACRDPPKRGRRQEIGHCPRAPSPICRFDLGDSRAVCAGWNLMPSKAGSAIHALVLHMRPSLPALLNGTAALPPGI